MEKTPKCHLQERTHLKAKMLLCKETSTNKKVLPKPTRRAQSSKDHQPGITVLVDHLTTTVSSATTWSHPLWCNNRRRSLLQLALLSKKWTIFLKMLRRISSTATSWSTTSTSAYKSTRRSWRCTRRGSAESKTPSSQESSRSMMWKRLRLKLEFSSQSFNMWTHTNIKSQEWNASQTSLMTILSSQATAKRKRSAQETATTIATPPNTNFIFMISSVKKKMKLATSSKKCAVRNKISVTCHNQSHKWRWPQPSKQPWWPCKVVTHSSRTFSWCTTILKFFQTVKWSQAIINRWSWFRMLMHPKLTDSSKLNNNPWCNNKCQPHRKSSLLRLPRRTPNQCKIPNANPK